MNLDEEINKESLKIKVGGLLYKHHNEIPEILIDEKNRKEYLDFFNLISQICDLIGTQMMTIFAEICSTIHINTQKNILEGEIEEDIQGGFLNPMAIIAFAKEQSDEIIPKINFEKELILTGSNYCFIILFLQDSFFNYSYFLHTIRGLKYMDNELVVKTVNPKNNISIEKIQSTLSFILSNEFEELRKKFRVRECYKIAYSPRIYH